MSIQFRPYAPANRAACLHIFDGNAARFFSPGDRTQFEAFLAAPVGYYGVLCDEEEVVGCGGLAPAHGDPTCAVLTWGMIDARHHGKGWGRMLLESRLRWLTEMPQATRVVLHTSHETAGFYRKMGFRERAFVPDGYRAGLHRCDLEL
jgi:ribosomal protein S18 acetylase RimI-like enzyme